MAGCDPMTFENVNAQAFGYLKNKLAAVGYQLEGNEGTIKGPMGIVITYNWLESQNLLYVQVIDKNFFVPCSRIRMELEKAVIESIG